jgi:5-methylcytosine-specific restriction endonuclease McrA
MDTLTEDRKVLLLNASEQVIGVIDWWKAVTMLMQGKARSPFNYEHCYDIKTGSGVFRLPSALVLVNYVFIPYRLARPSKRNITRRDNNECQYCGCHVSGERVTIDHVMPKSRGGKHEWTNVVVSCKKCNAKKSNRTPNEANMKLKTHPVAPKRGLLFVEVADEYHKTIWSRWLT